MKEKVLTLCCYLSTKTKERHFNYELRIVCRMKLKYSKVFSSFILYFPLKNWKRSKQVIKTRLTRTNKMKKLFSVVREHTHTHTRTMLGWLKDRGCKKEGKKRRANEKRRKCQVIEFHSKFNANSKYLFLFKRREKQK